MRRVLPALLLAAAAACLSGCGDGGARGVQPGQKAPAFKLSAVGGERVKSSSLEGSPLVINFWQTTCPPCVKEIPELNALSKKGQIRVVGINVSEGPDRVAAFVEKYDIAYPVLLGDDATFLAYRGSVIPYTLVLDGEFRVVRTYRGVIDPSAIERDLGMSSG